MEKNIVSVEHLSHKYSKNWAIRDINFEINQKGVLGLLGSNGAGKSTTMNILCGVLNQTEGNVFIDGINLREHPEQAKQLLGFLPQNAPLHLDLTVDEYLRYCAFIRNIEKKQIKAAVEAAKDRCGIAHFSQRLISNLSGGYRQRVGIAQAIIHQPKLVVLDEPTNGLDPIQILEVRKLIREIAEERSVIFSTHILSEVQATCNDIRMIEGGRMVFADTMEAFNNYILPNSLLVSLDNPPALAELEAINGVTSAELLNDQRIRIRFKASGTISKKIVELSINNGWQLTEILLEKSSLDEIFAQLSNRPLR
ncbi:ABC transporter ATP-binding protein [Mucilaginibacter paludis]|uniref:ABC transporter related protein n=1 Tax=Mucilaginibacter paludis DSM 18603 TaxID=714943 RepID=H1Y877_9SPHI|nr:ABC transporter ATP-binding protein [Mucilaginibacter paludis]EHQ24896.1 ABC transporter related protein [Mucilaginibacter paludis DSM 18603]